MDFKSCNVHPNHCNKVLVRGYGERKKHYIYEIANFERTITGHKWIDRYGKELVFKPEEYAELPCDELSFKPEEYAKCPDDKSNISLILEQLKNFINNMKEDNFISIEFKNKGNANAFEYFNDYRTLTISYR